MQVKEAIAKMVKVLTEIESLNDELKAIKEDAKESQLNVSIISAVAKSIVSNKVQELQDKSTEILEMIELSRS